MVDKNKKAFQYQETVDVGALAQGIVDMFVVNDVSLSEALAALMVAQVKIGGGEDAQMTAFGITYRFSKLEVDHD